MTEFIVAHVDLQRTGCKTVVDISRSIKIRCSTGDSAWKNLY